MDSLSFHVKAKELNAEYIETLLNGIQAECVALNFSTCQGHVVELAGLLVAYFQKKEDVYKRQGLYVVKHIPLRTSMAVIFVSLRKNNER